MLLDLKRSNQIMIAIAKFKKTHTELRDCVLMLNEAVIKAEDIQSYDHARRQQRSSSSSRPIYQAAISTST